MVNFGEIGLVKDRTVTGSVGGCCSFFASRVVRSLNLCIASRRLETVADDSSTIFVLVVFVVFAIGDDVDGGEEEGDDLKLSLTVEVLVLVEEVVGLTDRCLVRLYLVEERSRLVVLSQEVESFVVAALVFLLAAEVG